MAKSASPISGVAERYAGSVFELARDSGAIASVEKDLGRFEALLAGSEWRFCVNWTPPRSM